MTFQRFTIEHKKIVKNVMKNPTPPFPILLGDYQVILEMRCSNANIKQLQKVLKSSSNTGNYKFQKIMEKICKIPKKFPSQEYHNLDFQKI